MGATLVERYILDRIDDPRLSVYIVWEPNEPADTEQEAAAAARFVPDPRATHFWADKRFAGTAFKDVVGFKERPVWDLYMFFPAGVSWGGTTPGPATFFHYQRDLPREKVFNAESMAKEIKALLEKAPAPRP